jgi:hypothetical protein
MTTGSGAPSAACAVPTSSNLAMYWDSVGLNIYYCSATTPTWQKFSTDGNGQGLSGSIEFMGTTSGGAGFAVSDVAAATQILYMLPTTNGTANQVLYDTGSATCGTYTTGSPALCHQLAWETAPFTLVSSPTAHALYAGNTTSAPNVITVPSADALLYGTTGADPAFKALPTGGTNGCSGSTDMLQWNNSTHAFACGTASGGTSVNVNGSSVSSPNFNGSTPAAQAGYQNAALQVSSSSVSIEVPITYAVEQNACGTGSYTLRAADNASVIQFSAICAVTVPTGLGAGFNVIVEQTGSGTVTFTGSGTTLYQLYGSASTAGQWAKVALYSDTDTVWQLSGNLTGVLAAGNVSGLGSLATLSTATIATGGTNATSAASAGLVPNTSSTSASAWTATPTLGVAASATGSTTYANATGSGTFTVGASPSTTTNTLLGPTAVIANNHLIGCTTSTTTCTMTDVTPSASLVNLGSVTNDAQTKASVVPNTTAVGAIPDGTSTSAASWTITPTLGNPATTTGTLAFANATGSGTFTLGASPSTTSNTLLGPTAVPVTGHLLDVTVAGTVATLHDSGLATANIDTSTTTKPLAYGGTGVDLSAAGGAVNTTGAQVLHENAAHVISSSAIALVDLPTITVPYGGTGLATLTAHAVQVGEGTSTPAQVGPNAATTYPLFSAGSSADPAFRAIAVGDLPVLHGQCTEAWGGSGTLFAMTSGDDAIVNNTCYNDSGATRTITAVKCRSDNAANSTAITPTFGAAGTGTTILTGAVTCGNSYAYAAGTLDTGSHIAWTTGTGIDPGMTTVGNATSIALLIEYTYQPY